MLTILALCFFSLLKGCRTSVQTHYSLNERFKLLWTGLSTVCAIDLPHPERKKLPSWLWGERCPQNKAERRHSLGTLRENYFLSPLPSWEAWILHPLWERACRFLCWNKNWGGALGTCIFTSTLGTAVAVPLCPSWSHARECSCTAQLSQSLQKVSRVMVQAWVSSAVCTSSLIPLLGIHHCTNGISKGTKYSQIMSAAPDIASQPTAAHWYWSMGQRRKHLWPEY